MLTFQDFEAAGNRAAFLRRAISEHRASEAYRVAREADEYDRQRNTTIYSYVKTIYSMAGTPMEDFTASNNRVASNFFHRLNTQRCAYSLGNGVTFANKTQQRVDGRTVTVDTTKQRLGPQFDTDLYRAAYLALIHGVSFALWNYDRLYVFPLTEFAPLWDEENGTLRTGIRFWQLSPEKPTTAVLYEEDGYTTYRTGENGDGTFRITQEKRGYIQRVRTTEAGGEEIIGEDNYGSLPVVPLWGSRLHQSTLVGMQHAIDSYDLIQSGFANDLTDCAQIYWLVGNAMGMSQEDLRQFMDRLKLWHVAVADTDNSTVTPYTQEIPFQARAEYLSHIRNSIYEAFGALDVHTIAAGSTNDHIDAAYQPMDEEADDFEYQLIAFVQQVLRLLGIEDTPVFKRNRVSNVKEQVETVMLEAQYLDAETLLGKLPNVTVDEIPDILARMDGEGQSRFDALREETDETEEE